MDSNPSCTRSVAKQTLADLLRQNFVLEFLLSQDLATLLTSSHQVGHHLLRWAVGYIFEHLKTLCSKIACHLVGEASQLTEPNRAIGLKIKVFS